MAEPPPEDDLAQVLLRLERRLVSTDAAPFTPQAYGHLKERIAEYIGELIDESSRVARRRGSSDIISRADVDRASEHLGVRPRNRQSQIIGSLGSLLLGAAVGNALQIAGQPQITPETALLTFGAGVVGAAMTVLGFMRD